MSSRRTTIPALVAAIALVLASCGSGDAGATGGVAQAAATAESSDGTTTPESSDVFDSSVVHDISVSYDPDDYDAMIATFEESGDKEWIEATVTIDGVTYDQVGIRLKGNSSLMGLGGAAAPGGGLAGGDAPGGGAGGPAGGAGGDPATEASADVPEELPWLIRLDKFVDGQEHDGYVDLVVRSNRSESALNEAVALDLLTEAGLASQASAATSFSINGSDEVLRLVIDHPDDDAWQDAAFDGDGAIYKAESTGDWSYRGDDPASYDEVFDQEGGATKADLTPVIDLLQFIDEADDATFEAELPEMLDVESFARYLAMMDLVANSDDIDGPGNNAYLWYDVETEQFTVVPWDMNLTFGSMGGGGGVPGADAAMPGADGAVPGARAGGPAGGPPTDGAPPAGVEGSPLGGPAGAAAAGAEATGAGPGAGGDNPLVERFHDTASFEALYQEALVQLRAELYESGTADAILATWVTTLTGDASDLIDPQTVESEAATIAQFFDAE